MSNDSSVARGRRRLADSHFPAFLGQERITGARLGPEAASGKNIPMETFKWIVGGLLGTLAVAVGWFLSGIQSDLRDVRKEVVGIRIEATVTNTKLEELIAEFRRRNPR